MRCGAKAPWNDIEGTRLRIENTTVVRLLVFDDPTLEPRDILVMCPDIETFAPLIHATFGAGADPDDGGDHDAPVDLRVRLADRSLRQTNPVLGAVWNLLALADSRVTASQVLDFAGREPVRRRFRLDDDDLSRISEWVAATGIRWGLDAPHRAPFHLDGLAQNTWSAGLDRVLLGVAMADEDQRLVGGAVPLDDVDSGSIDLAGRFGEREEIVRAVLVRGQWRRVLRLGRIRRSSVGQPELRLQDAQEVAGPEGDEPG